MSDCLFCNIIDGGIPADIIYQDDDVLAFNDINPQAPVHFLVIPKKHIATVNDLQSGDAELVGKLYLAAQNLLRQKNQDSYRLVMNCNEQAGQTVFHIHLHVLAGRDLGWPPG